MALVSRIFHITRKLINLVGIALKSQRSISCFVIAQSPVFSQSRERNREHLGVTHRCLQFSNSCPFVVLSDPVLWVLDSLANRGLRRVMLLPSPDPEILLPLADWRPSRFLHFTVLLSYGFILYWAAVCVHSWESSREHAPRCQVQHWIDVTERDCPPAFDTVRLEMFNTLF